MQGKSISWQQRPADLNEQAENYGKLGRESAIQLAAAVGCLVVAGLCFIGAIGLAISAANLYVFDRTLWALSWRAIFIVILLLIAVAFVSVFLKLWAETWKDVEKYRLYVERQRAARLRGLDALGGVQTAAEIKEWSASPQVFASVLLGLIALYIERKDRGQIGGIRKYEEAGFWIGHVKVLSGSFHGVRGIMDRLDDASFFEGREEGARGDLVITDVDLETAVRRLVREWKQREG